MQNESIIQLTPELISLKHKLIKPSFLEIDKEDSNLDFSEYKKSQNIAQTGHFRMETLDFSNSQRKEIQNRDKSQTQKTKYIFSNHQNHLPHVKKVRKVYSQTAQRKEEKSQKNILSLDKNSETSNLSSSHQKSFKIHPYQSLKAKNDVNSNYLKVILAFKTPSRNKTQREQKSLSIKAKKQQNSEQRIKLKSLVYRQRYQTSNKKKLKKGQNFYDLTTQYAKPYLTFQQIYHLKNQDLTLSFSQILPRVPKRQQLQKFLKNYQPQNPQLSIQRLVKSNFCAVQYKSRSVYIGQMIGQAKSGMGLYITKNFCFQGLWKANNKVKGVEITKNGIYKGTFQDNQPQGRGQFQWHTGQCYTGEWHQGLHHGYGLWINSQGDNYRGQWKSGKAQGQGMLQIKRGENSKGRKYKGIFVNFRQAGYGKQIFENGDVFEGIFKNDKPHGRGTYRWSNRSKYMGDFLEGKRIGLGQLKTNQNLLYNGQFKLDKPEGLCKIEMPNGDVYYGTIKQGRKNGKGTLTLRQGKVYNGYWKDDFYLGKHAQSN